MKQRVIKDTIIDLNKSAKHAPPTDYKHQFDLLYKGVTDTVILVSGEGIILSVNRSFLGIDAEQIHGKKIDELDLKGSKPIYEILQQVVSTGNSRKAKYQHVPSEIWYFINFLTPSKENNVFLIITEISENKYLNGLSSFEHQFVSNVIDIANIIILILDTERRIIKVNPYLEKITGFQMAEIEGKDWFNIFIDPEDHYWLEDVWKTAINGKSTRGIINCIKTKHGKNLTIEWNDKALIDQQGKCIGLLAFGHDITERVETENALKETTTQLANAMKIARIGYWEYDIANNLLHFNDQFYTLFHVSADDIGGYTMSVERYIEQFVYDEDKDIIAEFIEGFVYGGKINDESQIEHRTKLQDGSLATILVRIIVLKNDKNEVVKILGANQDVTERVKFEEAIRVNEAQLSNAMKMARLGCWEYDVSSNLFTFNDNFYSIFRSSVEKVGSYQMTPQQYADRFLFPDDRAMVYDETQKALETKDSNFSRQLEHRITYEDGEIGYISVRIYIVKDKDGRTIKTFGANQDITEQKQIEKKLEEQNAKYAALNQKLEESLDIVKKMNVELEYAKNKAEENDKLKSAFLANMSHEIRTPMNGIMGFAKMLNRKGLSDERRQQYTDIINEMSGQLLHMIDEIIDISKIETGQIVIHNTKTNINDVCFRLFSLYKTTAERNNINLYVQKDLSDERAEILTDSTKFRQIVDNLLRNAIKFTHQGYVKFGYQLKDNGFLEFYVEDTGIGIAPEMQIMIFERFRQAEEGVSKLYGGTGLGLSISKSFVEKLGGKIWVKSVLEKGSTFYFTLPYIPTTISGVNFLNDSRKENSLRIPTIMVVEDEEINYLYIEEVLLDSNIKILHAKRGKEAIELFKSNSEIDLILLDIKLPDINGIDVMRTLKGINPSVPIIAQTAYALAGDMESVIEAGFDDYIAKPIDDKELINKINRYLIKI